MPAHSGYLIPEDSCEISGLPARADGWFTAFWKLYILSSLVFEPETIPPSPQLASGLGLGQPTDINAARLMGWGDREPGP